MHSYKLLKKVDRRLINRRALERVALPLKGTAVLDIGGALNQREITTRDLSVDGAYFLTDLCPRASDKVSLRLPITEAEASFEAVGTVIRVELISESNFGVVVKFDKAPNVD